MNRRQLLRQTGAATGGVAGLAGMATAAEPTHVSWVFEDGTEETIPIEEFEARADTPQLADIESGDDDTGGCCACPDSTLCNPCFVLVCY